HREWEFWPAHGCRAGVGYAGGHVWLSRPKPQSQDERCDARHSRSLAMKIARVQTFLTTPGTTRNCLFVKLETDDPLLGWGEGDAARALRGVRQRCRFASRSVPRHRSHGGGARGISVQRAGAEAAPRPERRVAMNTGGPFGL